MQYDINGAVSFTGMLLQHPFEVIPGPKHDGSVRETRMLRFKVNSRMPRILFWVEGIGNEKSARIYESDHDGDSNDPQWPKRLNPGHLLAEATKREGPRHLPPLPHPV